MVFFVGLLFFLGVVQFSSGIRIIWDKDASVDYNEIDQGMTEEIRIANWLFIYPGTKWCGAGNIANNDDDLGKFSTTDKCCRSHDFCKDVIEGYQTAYNLTNKAFYSRLSCSCDEEFYRCLKLCSTKTATRIGNIYFNALKTQCFKNEFPIVKCVKHIYFPRRKCITYELDEALPKMYQWFDVPVY